MNYRNNNRRPRVAPVEQVQAWQQANPAAFDWLTRNAGTSDFAFSLLQALASWGSLTPNQLAAVERSIARDAARANPPPASTVAGGGYTKLLEAFQKARTSGLKWPKVHVGDIRFSLAGETSKNPGSIYVKTDTNEVYLGKISPQGEFRRSFDCTPAYEEFIIQVGSDPLAQAVAHGKRTGHCAICSRKLTDPESVDRGIGPVCATKFGW